MNSRLTAIALSILVLVACEKPPSSAPQSNADARTGASESTDAESAFRLEPLTIESSMPGAPKLPAAVADELRVAVEARADAVAKGDREWGAMHLSDGRPAYTNRLLLEDSPYLQQHAHNPVNWYPWGDEAFARASAEGKPVLLSIGYATCHWCHVMERESFEDVEVARLLNENYIAVKVDREERPDVDALYMAAVRQLSGSAGWPATLWLTPDREPFFAGTYFPARDGDRAGSPGFLPLLEQQHELFGDDPAQVGKRGREVASALRAEFELKRGALIRDAGASMRKAFYAYERQFDDSNGGWGRRKFPMPARLRFLVRFHARTGDERALAMLEKTLEAMVTGGIHDHVGGGFHRYTVDPAWQVPHFEKMLYDNAQLALFFTEAGLALERPELFEVARRTLDFMHRDMRGDRAAYYSALDAETDGVEGKSYVWSAQQIQAAGAGEELRVVAHRSLPEGKGVVVLKGDAPLSPEHASRLWRVRAERAQPKVDFKVVASWNGMALEALAKLGFVLGDDELLERAIDLASFLERKLWDEDRGTLYRTWTAEGGRGEVGTASDYVHVVAGLLELFQSTGDSRWLALARSIDAALHARHFDHDRGAYRRAANTVGLLAAELPVTDSAVPGANGAAYVNLLNLYALTREATYKARSSKLRDALSGYVVEEPWEVPTMLTGVDFATNRPREVVVVSRSDDSPLVKVLRQTYSPAKVAVAGTPTGLDGVKSQVPWAAKKGFGPKGQERAFVCYDTVCDLPTTDPDRFREQLEASEAL